MTDTRKTEAELVEHVARALAELDIREKRRFDTAKDELEEMLPASVTYAWPQYIKQAQTAIAAYHEATEPYIVPKRMKLGRED